MFWLWASTLLLTIHQLEHANLVVWRMTQVWRTRMLSKFSRFFKRFYREKHNCEAKLSNPFVVNPIFFFFLSELLDWICQCVVVLLHIKLHLEDGTASFVVSTQAVRAPVRCARLSAGMLNPAEQDGVSWLNPVRCNGIYGPPLSWNSDGLLFSLEPVGC